MTPESQRIAMAEFCGWTECYHKNDEYGTGLYGKRPSGDYDWIPDYLNDLNAVHEAVVKLLFSRRQVYYDNLRLVCSRGLPEGCYVADIECSNATAAQRCEALLRTIGKWVGE